MLLINIKSKNKKSIFNITKTLILLFLKLNAVKKITNKKHRLTSFNILKSPHIHKKAQQRFGFEIITINIFLLIFSLPKIIILTKLLLNKLFHDLNIKLIYHVSKKNKIIKKIKFKTIKITFCSNFYKKIKKSSTRIQKIRKLLNILITKCKLM